MVRAIYGAQGSGAFRPGITKFKARCDHLAWSVSSDGQSRTHGDSLVRIEAIGPEGPSPPCGVNAAHQVFAFPSPSGL